MTNSVFQRALNGQTPPAASERSTALLIATDGTAQSESAVAFAHLLSLKDECDVIALTVVDRPPIPWGAVDESVVREYERGQLQAAQRRATAQVERLGNKDWTVDVRSGDPATTIAALARESGARLVVVGLGGHGPAARFFGNETALRLMRLSETPVLAVSKMRALPRSVAVAMDFSEASIEAARLAIEIAAPGAILTLIHVVPWERNEYVPEQWFTDHEAYVAGQLKRVAGWLDHHDKCRIHQKIVYGKPGPSILACAEALDADLIVAGTHGRGFIGRVLGGETLAKLVRGAHRSLLVLPHAAAFQRAEPVGEDVQSETSAIMNGHPRPGHDTDEPGRAIGRNDVQAHHGTN